MLNRGLQILAVHRLEQIALRPQFDRLLGVSEIAVSANDQVISCDVLFPCVRHQRQSVHIGHADIGNDELDAVLAKQLQRFNAIPCAVNAVRLERELAHHSLQAVADMLLIVHNQHIDQLLPSPQIDLFPRQPYRDACIGARYAINGKAAALAVVQLQPFVHIL